MAKVRYFYAVQVGSNYDWDYGSYRHAEARKMATAEHLRHPDEEVRIAKIDEEYGHCEKEEIIYKAKAA